jgi:hypothetical protein
VTELEKIAARNQLRAARRQALHAWLADTDSGNRWDGDDGALLRFDEWNFWSDAIKAAEQAKFEALDAEYEAAKAEEGL